MAALFGRWRRMQRRCSARDVDDDVLWEAFQIAPAPRPRWPDDGDGEQATDPRTLLAPEWTVLSDRGRYTRYSGGPDFRAVRRGLWTGACRRGRTAVVAVEKLKKVNAFMGFTRIDAFDRIDDAAERVAPLDAATAAHLGARHRRPRRGRFPPVRRRPWSRRGRRRSEGGRYGSGTGEAHG